MGKANFLQQFQFFASAVTEARCCPFSYTIENQDCSIFKGGGVEGTRSVRVMVMAK
jgi:hypothetical protein